MHSRVHSLLRPGAHRGSQAPDPSDGYARAGMLNSAALGHGAGPALPPQRGAPTPRQRSPHVGIHRGVGQTWETASACRAAMPRGSVRRGPSAVTAHTQQPASRQPATWPPARHTPQDAAVLACGARRRPPASPGTLALVYSRPRSASRPRPCAASLPGVVAGSRQRLAAGGRSVPVAVSISLTES